VAEAHGREEVDSKGRPHLSDKDVVKEEEQEELPWRAACKPCKR
jgi:hypothetical protein